MAGSKQGGRKLQVAGYARVSTVRQAERDLSIPDQHRQIAEYCAQQGWTLVDSYTEPGVSGREESRPEFQRMLERAYSDDRPFDVILVHSFSRFARDHVLLEVQCRKLMAEGVRLVAVTQSVDDSPEGQLMRGLYGLFDQYSSAQNSKHTLRAMKQNARNGYWNGSRPPDGYRLVVAARVGDKTKHVLAIDPERSKLIRKIFALARVGDGKGPMGVKGIATWLNDHGHRTVSGSRWGIGTIHMMLTKTCYVGEHYFNVTGQNKLVKPREEWIKLDVPPIVDRETFDAVGQNLKARNPRRAAPRTASSPMLLSGLIRCEACGAAMTQITGKGGRYVYYGCANRKRTGTDACTGKSIPQQRVEELVCDAVVERILSVQHLDKLVAGCIARARAQSTNDQEIRAAQRELLEAEGGLKRLYDAIAKGLLDPGEPMLKQQLDGLRLRKTDAEELLARSRAIEKAALTPPSAAKIKTFADQLVLRLTQGDIALRKAYLRAFVDQVVVGPKEIHIRGRKDVLAAAATKGKVDPEARVPTFVPEWRARQESNL
ncbi:MAG: recombinase family protein [Panacagrimonas sp.]